MDPIPTEIIHQKIFVIRGQKVLFDRDLALLYGVSTRDLNKAISRNKDRFPSDFMFQLTQKEFEDLMFHFGTSSWGGTRKRPSVFTEHGVLSLSSVLRSKKAAQVNIAIMRAFVKLRQMISSHRELASKLDTLEKRMDGHDQKIQELFTYIKNILEPAEEKPKRRMGFHKSED